MENTRAVRFTRRLLAELGVDGIFGVTSGLVAKTGGTTFAGRSIAAPPAGITVTNGDGVAGNPSLALANDLAGIEALNTLGTVTRTGDGTFGTYVAAMADLTAAAEAANTIAVTLATVTPLGVAIARAQRYRAQVLDANGLQTVVANWRIGIGGGGVAVSGNNQPQVLLDTGANGQATLSVLDVGGAFAGTVYLLVEPLGVQPGPNRNTGFATMIPLTFA